MALKELEPAALATRTGPGVISSAAIDWESSLTTLAQQVSVSWLARRARLTLPTARAIATANGWGRP